VETAPDLPPEALQTLRQAMSAEAGVVRDAVGLGRLLITIEALAARHGWSLPLVTARLIAAAALARRESRGGHFRRDFPQTDAVGLRTVGTLTKLTAHAAIAA
jgi:L-aspartate oxidase